MFEKIRHRYTCEHCGHTGEWTESELKADTAQDFCTTLIIAKKWAENNDYSKLKSLDGKCPACDKHQSWELNSAKSKMKTAPLTAGLLVSGSTGVGFSVPFRIVVWIARGTVIWLIVHSGRIHFDQHSCIYTRTQ